MSLVKTNGNHPSRSIFTDLFDLDNFFGSEVLHKELFRNVPAVNVKEDDNQFNIEVAAPGLEKKDFKITVDNGLLSISAEKQEEKNEESENFKRREFNYSSFSRSFSLPKSVKEEDIQAEYQNGLLKLVIPKKEEAKKNTKKEISIN